MTETNTGETGVVASEATVQAPAAALGDGVVRTLEEARKLIEDAGADGPEPAAPKADDTQPETPKAERKARAIAENAKKQAAFFKEKQQVEAKAKRIAVIEDIAAKVKAGEADPDELFSELGTDYRAITEAKLRNGKKPPTELESFNERVAALEKELADSKAALQAREMETRRTEATRSVMGAINSTLDAGGDRWDAIKAYGAQDEVLVEMQRSLKESATEFDEQGVPLDGEALTAEEAADIVEERLAERLRKGLSTKYARQLAGQPLTAPTETTTGHSTASGTGSRTLTNGHGTVGGGGKLHPDGIARYDTLEQTRAALRAMLGADE